MGEIEETLLLADVGVMTTERVMSAITERMTFMKWSKAEQLRDELRKQIGLALTQDGTLTLADEPFAVPVHSRPYVIMIVGVNGVGKTTTIGKLAYNYRNAGRKVVIGAADTFRAAANSQLEVWADRAGVEIVQQHPGADPSAVAYDTIKSAMSKDADVVLIDTAGRLPQQSESDERTREDVTGDAQASSRSAASDLPRARRNNWSECSLASP